MRSENSLSVLWLIKSLRQGGAEVLLSHLSRSVAQSGANVECAYLFGDADLVAEIEKAGVVCRCIGGRNKWTWTVRLLRVIRAGKYDVVHCHSPLPAVVARVAVLSLPRRKRPAMLTTEHNTWTSYHSLTRFALKLSQSMNEYTFNVSRESFESIPRSAQAKAEVLVHGIPVSDVALDRNARPEVRSELDFKESDFVIGTVANMRLQKDYPNLISALAELARRGHQFSFVAVGDGPMASTVDDLVRRELPDRRTLLLGRRNDATRIMSSFDLFVLASSWEGLPVVVMEALALKLPIVATSVGGVQEHLANQGVALLVPPSQPLALANAIEQAIADAGLRRSMEEAAGSFAHNFDSSRWIARTWEMYDQLTSGRRKARPAP